MSRLVCTVLVPGVLAVATAAVACRSAEFVSPATVAGTYQLATVTGQPVPTSGSPAVLSGSIVLGADGSATRQIRYATASAPAGQEVVARGRFSVRGDSVQLAVVEDAARPTLVSRWYAIRQGTTLTLRFPAPADGPDEVEVYQRR